ncbi:MAG: hypothetical protein OHK93_002792 [Ramalina farinacea]|uniref:Uncharacterized protein n=1 Tax=Ramalina farinacea TaxID=258253 RepID=A0AA43TXI4_9LECA|nr:hypothetical protein [Ramalina farinacea]
MAGYLVDFLLNLVARQQRFVWHLRYWPFLAPCDGGLALLGALSRSALLALSLEEKEELVDDQEKVMEDEEDERAVEEGEGVAEEDEEVAEEEEEIVDGEEEVVKEDNDLVKLAPAVACGDRRLPRGDE